jgi:hypothetical protein
LQPAATGLLLIQFMVRLGDYSMTPIGLARKISRLGARSVATAEFERELYLRGLWNFERERKKYSSQKEHWLNWLSQYGTAGYYGRKNHKVRSAETVYNRIGCPPMLLWLAEAVGVSKRQIQSAKQSALSVTPSYARQCSAIRKVIPWGVVSRHLRQPRAAQLARKL